MIRDDAIATSELVKVMDGKVVADSRDVAQAFERQHAHVLRTIRDLLTERPDLAANFSAASALQPSGFGERAFSYFVMDRKGFVILVSGLNGRRALDFRIAFFDAFDRLEGVVRRMEAEAAELSAPPAPDASILEDQVRAQTAISFVQTAHLASGSPAARRAWDIAGLPDVFGPVTAQRGVKVDPVIAGWFSERVERVEDVRTPTSLLFEDYQYWCRANGHAAMSMTVFGRQLSAIGVAALRSNGIKRLGVRLLPFGAVPGGDGRSGGASDPDLSDEAGERWGGRALSKLGVH